jgi:transaldolase / glucose-6-phosphate isomerase
MGINRQSYSLPENLISSVEGSLEDWAVNNKGRRLWARDASLWTGSDEGNWLGWLGIVDEQSAESRRPVGFAEEIRDAGFSHALPLGMGGSSLCPEVLRMTFGKLDGYPELHVLDSTDPAQIETFEGKVDLANTLFIGIQQVRQHSGAEYLQAILLGTREATDRRRSSG